MKLQRTLTIATLAVMTTVSSGLLAPDVQAGERYSRHDRYERHDRHYYPARRPHHRHPGRRGYGRPYYGYGYP